MTNFRQSSWLFLVGTAFELILLIAVNPILAIIAPAYSSEVDKLMWVVSPYKNESHYMACHRLNSVPIPSQAFSIKWDIAKVKEVSAALGCAGNDSSELSSSPVKGCCTPGLWYNATSNQCFTQSLGSTFANYGWFDDSSLPIYSCALPSTSSLQVTGSFSNVSIHSARYSSTGFVTILGHGLSSSSAEFELGNQQCSQPDVCSTSSSRSDSSGSSSSSMCRSCDGGDDLCGTGSICLEMWSSGHHCYPYCAGDEDRSCPCGSTCITVSVHSKDEAKLLRQIHICSPMKYGADADSFYESADAGCSAFHVVDPQSASHSAFDVVRCAAPTVPSVQPIGLYKPYSGGDLAVVTIAALSAQGSAALDTPLLSMKELSSAHCDSDADCFDGDLCTLEHCERQQQVGGVGGRCIAERMPNCVSSSRLLQDSQTPYSYLSFTAYDSTDVLSVESAFQSCISENGEHCNLTNVFTSSVSISNDFPIQSNIPIRFDFPFFGNIVNLFAINPNGLIQFPPMHDCSGPIDSFRCVVYSTESNVLSLWSADWDLSLSADSRVLVGYSPSARQLVGSSSSSSSSSSSRNDSNPTAVHILFQHAHRAKGTVSNSNSNSNSDSDSVGNTFSGSLYEDGSIKVRYHRVNSADLLPSSQHSRDVLGMRGSKLSSNAKAQAIVATDVLSVRYSEELIDRAAVRDSYEVSYCLMNAIGCVLNACVSAGDAMSIQWNGFQCDALSSIISNSSSYSIKCLFGGRVASSVPSFEEPVVDPAHPRRLLQPGKLICPVPDLPFEDGALFRVDIAVVLSESAAAVWTAKDGSGLGAVHGVYRTRFGEISRASLMGRYWQRDGDASALRSCGCSALSDYSNDTCDSLLVCGGVEDTKDCAGEAFGSAYVDSCGNCAGGATNTIPSSACSHPPELDMLSMKLFSQVLVLIGVVFMTSFTVSSLSYYLRLTLMNRSMVRSQQARAQFDLESDFIRAQNESFSIPQPTSQRRGLSSFECDALGEVKYSASSSASNASNSAADVEKGSSSSVGEHSECSICLVDFEVGDACRQLPEPCGHVFHKACIDKWFEVSTQCPMCKRSVRQMMFGEDSSPFDDDAARTGAARARGGWSGGVRSGNMVNLNLRHREIEHILELLHGHNGRSRSRSRPSHSRGRTSASALSPPEGEGVAEEEEEGVSARAEDGERDEEEDGVDSLSSTAFSRGRSTNATDTESLRQLRRSIIMSLLTNISSRREQYSSSRSGRANRSAYYSVPRGELASGLADIRANPSSLSLSSSSPEINAAAPSSSTSNPMHVLSSIRSAIFNQTATSSGSNNSNNNNRNSSSSNSNNNNTNNANSSSNNNNSNNRTRDIEMSSIPLLSSAASESLSNSSHNSSSASSLDL